MGVVFSTPAAGWWALVPLGLMLIAAAVVDVWKGKIPNTLTYPAIVIGLVGHTLLGGVMGDDRALGLVGSLAGLATGFVPMLLVWKAGGIGGGDVKMMAAIGALGGWRFTLAALLYGLLVAVVMAMVVMIRKGIVKRTLGRVFRFLAMAFSPARPVDPSSADSPTVPFGLAMCIGAALAVVELVFHGPVAGKFLLGI